jgi:hypothetical protein
VWSHARIIKWKDFDRKIGNRFLKLIKDTRGYLQIGLSKDNKKKIYLVSRLGAIAFIPNPDSLFQVNHKDGVKTNNYVGTAAKKYKDGNLEWCTNQDNKKHASENKLWKFKKASEFYGVSFSKSLGNRNKPWRAQIKNNRKQIHIGSYKTEIEAAEAYNKYVILHNLNRPLNKLKKGRR